MAKAEILEKLKNLEKRLEGTKESTLRKVIECQMGLLRMALNEKEDISDYAEKIFS